MKKFFQEFKAFISKGNVVDLAVAVVVGAAFQKIINSVVDDLIMPFISLITGGVDFSSWFIVLGENPDNLKTITELKEAGIATFAYGNLINAVINFLILAFVVFLLVKMIAKAQNLVPKKPKEEPAPTTKKCPYCLSEIDIKATRCPHCTSELPEETEKAE
ncbi:MAG: large conductance mechanosensitive channel protein MscL [Eubacteriales bacterium]|nr:large conductance mechanosensitive channel protein MscL [Eubacteriales bacterium]